MLTLGVLGVNQNFRLSIETAPDHKASQMGLQEIKSNKGPPGP